MIQSPTVCTTVHRSVFQKLVICCTLCLVRAGVADEITSTTPHWVWVENNQGDDSPIVESQTALPSHAIRRTFVLSSGFQRATLRIATDFCHARIRINGRVLTTIGPYSAITSSDATDYLTIGSNTLQIDLLPEVGPSAVACSLVTHVNEHEQLTLTTSSDWETLDGRQTIRNLGPVPSELWGDRTNPIELSPTDNYQQWKQAAKPTEAEAADTFVAEPKFRILPGFEIQQLRSALPEEGSWISMAFDPDGRLTISREDRGLLRMTLADDLSRVERVETINDQLLECRGLLYAHDSLYANANNSKALFRLRDQDDDGIPEHIELLREYGGGVGHGRNDLALGPDGWIWSIHGDSVNPPDQNAAVDLTSPLRDSRRGPRLREGHVVRVSPDGSQAELVCSGLRNPYGIAFDRFQNAFTYDADNEYDMGTPWYRGTRIWQLFAGSDFGWRITQGSWPPYFTDRADNATAVLATGKGSPTAIMFGRNLNFPPPYRDCLYVLDWAYGRVLAVHMARRGASRRSNAELFLQGLPLNVTDLAEGPDGALYLITGGRKTQSALYRIAWTANRTATAGAAEIFPGVARTHEQDCHDSAALIAEEIRQGELYLRADSPDLQKTVQWALEHIASADPHLRTLANVTLQRTPHEYWAATTLAIQHPGEFLEASLSLVRCGDREIVAETLKRLLRDDHASCDLFDSQRLRVISVRLQSFQDAYANHPDLFGSETIPSLVTCLTKDLDILDQTADCICYGDSKRSVMWRLAVAAGNAGASPESAAYRNLLRSSSQEDQLAAMLALRSSLSLAGPELTAQFFHTLNAAGDYSAGDGMKTFVKNIREDALKNLSNEQRTQFGAIPVANNQSSPLPTPRPAIQQWTMDKLQQLIAERKPTGDAMRGSKIFRDALCIHCHRYGSAGNAVGPDLTWVAGRFSRKDLCESILYPSRVIAEPWQLTRVETASGLVHTGRLVFSGDYRSEFLQLSTNPLNPQNITTIDKKQVESLELVNVSPMPQGLLDGFNLQDFADLLSYLESHAAGALTQE